MGSTNKTTGYNLPQWIGTDKPTFLGDLNDAFLKIDEGMTENKGSSTSAIAQAGEAVQNSTLALSKASSVENTANQANTNANNAITIANSVSDKVDNVESNVNAQEIYISNAKNWVAGNITSKRNDITIKGGFTNYNNGLSLFNLALRCAISPGLVITEGTLLFQVSGIPLPNNTDRTIYGGAYCRASNGDVIFIDLGIKKDGTIYAASDSASLTISAITIQLMCCTAKW